MTPKSAIDICMASETARRQLNAMTSEEIQSASTTTRGSRARQTSERWKRLVVLTVATSKAIVVTTKFDHAVKTGSANTVIVNTKIRKKHALPTGKNVVDVRRSIISNQYVN